MKITGIETFALQAPLEHGFGWSQQVTAQRQAALCVLHTDAGIEGVGEAFYFGGPAGIATAVMEQALLPRIIGMDPFDTNVIWDRLYNLTRDQGQKGLTISALSAIDLALWDIKGKALGLPVHKLLGGAYRDKAMVYATGLYEPQNVPSIVDALVEEASGYKAQGFNGMKLKVGYDLRTDISYVEAIRAAIGDDIYLMVDANHGYNAAEAIRLARELERYDVYWLEEPVPPEDIEGYVEVKANSNLLIAGGECEYTRYGFRELINRRAVDILQPDLCAAGGFTELAKVIAMASAANLPVIPHVWGTNVGLSAALQLFATLPHVPERRFPAQPFFEYDRTPNPLRDGVTNEQFEMSDGFLPIPDRPGLGVTLNRAFIEQQTA